MKFICPQCGGTEIAETATCPGVQRTIKVHDDVLEFGPDEPFGDIEGVQYECTDCGWVIPVTCEAELREWLSKDHKELTNTYWQVRPIFDADFELCHLKIVEELSSFNVVVRSLDQPTKTFIVSMTDLSESPIDAVSKAMEERLELKKQKDTEHKKAMKELSALMAKAIKRSNKSEQRKV